LGVQAGFQSVQERIALALTNHNPSWNHYFQEFLSPGFGRDAYCHSCYAPVAQQIDIVSSQSLNDRQVRLISLRILFRGIYRTCNLCHDRIFKLIRLRVTNLIQRFVQEIVKCVQNSIPAVTHF
jgi:hypothetical protein